MPVPSIPGRRTSVSMAGLYGSGSSAAKDGSCRWICVTAMAATGKTPAITLRMERSPSGLCGVAGGCGCFRRARGCFLFPFDADEFGNAGLLHGDAVEDRAHFHRLAIVGDHNELGLAAHFGEHAIEAADIGFIERRVHFVENAERAGRVAEDGNQQRERGES